MQNLTDKSIFQEEDIMEMLREIETGVYSILYASGFAV